ncbi:alcohol dehydrogenase [Bradyrhizobium sp. WBOS7]|uniref:Alcohol dehydrogenase n=1 Tax=Bradyrhizobium betae TaxID=244734 RepID=A0AAE9SRC6_9BRAD|nr:MULTISPECIES: cytochrome c [Bradyrhizobium]MDD1570293.1 alcohol dehydrogenase [Bradyrhizobium sp. WBOS1]UUO36573.1 alcohol dehydrogenase [Bradyrhizobium sp. WBOS01]MDD1526030.1 alcohol dehydrogenase [Bradyrhizobium sp. WBOS2]MDD1576913.1 alcohol dehydrogenase [Bradyrhizobium sp. WBOS7]MDD1599224.1 alcohol dehydrogenase [Bradyrhizobium sp. WBOS16]
MRTILTGSVVVGLALCSAVGSAARAAEPSPELIAYGKTLVEAGGCAGCHTADPARPFAGGKRIDTPFGAIYAPNLTPDRDTGIGAWQDADFTRALRYGIGPDGSNYYPAFPYPYFTKMTKDDTLAIRAYLGTLAPVVSRNKPPELRWPFGYRGLMRIWNAIYFKPGLFEPDQSKSAAWNRGGYLVTGLGHCGACHTPKNYFGADRDAQALAGNEVAGWFAPRLDGAARTGLKSWSEADIAEYLQSGRNARSHAGGPMADVVVNSTSKMSDADVRAIALYLKSLPPSRRETIVTPPDEAEMRAGQAVYAKLCVACHEADGMGAPRIYPPLPGNALLQSNNPSSTLRIILDGARTVTTPRAPNTGEMPGYAGQLSNEEIAAVTNYIRNSWGNAGLLVTPARVAKARKQGANGE